MRGLAGALLALAIAACASAREPAPPREIAAPPTSPRPPPPPPPAREATAEPDEPGEPAPPAVNVVAPRPPGAVAAVHVREDLSGHDVVVPEGALRAACGAGFRNGKCFGCPPDQPVYKDARLYVGSAIAGSFYPGKQAGYFLRMHSGEDCSYWDGSTFVVRGPGGWRQTRGWVFTGNCYRADLPDGARIVCATGGPSVGAAHVPLFHVVGLRPEDDAGLFGLNHDIDSLCRRAAQGRAIGLTEFGSEFWSAPRATPDGANILGIDVLYGRAADLKSPADCDVVTEPAPEGTVERLLGAPKRARFQFAVEGSKYTLLPESRASARAVGADLEPGRGIEVE